MMKSRESSHMEIRIIDQREQQDEATPSKYLRINLPSVAHNQVTEEMFDQVRFRESISEASTLVINKFDTMNNTQNTVKSPRKVTQTKGKKEDNTKISKKAM